MFDKKKGGTVPYFVFEELEQVEGFVHAFTCRQTDEMDGSRLTKPALLKALDIEPDRVVQLKQIHSDQVVVLREAISTACRADGIIVSEPGFFAVIKTADCLPVICVLPKQRKVCSLHAGWRGTRDRIASQGIRRFFSLTGARPDDCIVALGPCIRKCCYEVGPEVREQFAGAGHDITRLFSGKNLDLAEANLRQLGELGITRILDSGMCTACRTDLFYSYRREGQTGRLWALAGFRAPRL